MILPVPEIKKVSTATCEYFNRTCPGDQEGSIFNATMMSTLSTTAATTTAKSIPPEENMQVNIITNFVIFIMYSTVCMNIMKPWVVFAVKVLYMLLY